MRPTSTTFFACFLVTGILATGAGSVIAEPTLDCITDRQVYCSAQPVRIECTNNGGEFVVTGVTFLVTTAEGGLVFNPAVPAKAVAVPPGESVEHIWDQTFVNSPLGADGEQVPHGAYVVSVRNGRPARFEIGIQPDLAECAFEADGLCVDATASMLVWLDLMPVIPDLDDRIHALIGAKFENLSNDPVHVEIESVIVRGMKGPSVLFEFLVEPPAGWDGILAPGESAGGEWTKTELLGATKSQCNVDVVGILRVAIDSVDEADQEGTGASMERHDDNLLYVATEPTILSCVY